MKKILKLEHLEKVIKKIKNEKNTIVLAGGCFDILHKGHVQFLSSAKLHGDVLIILLESDEKVKELKGEKRPINSLQKRADALSKIPSVNYILPLPYLKNDLEYFFLVKTLKPDIIAITQGDPYIKVKIYQANKVKAQIIEVIQRLPGYSTTKIIETIQ